jgi:alpha-ketoglutarate-dependent dioxygenase FTO
MDTIKNLLSSGPKKRSFLEAEIARTDTAPSGDATERARKYVKALCKKKVLLENAAGECELDEEKAKKQPPTASVASAASASTATTSAKAITPPTTSATTTATNSIYPPAYLLPSSDAVSDPDSPQPTFLSSKHPHYAACLQTAYSTFKHEQASTIPAATHEEFHSAFSALDSIYQHDCTQPLGPGTPCAVTKVTRTLVGVPGITYKYLGLRMFAHSWDSPEHVALKACNSSLVARAASYNPKNSAFNLTLINRMASSQTHHHTADQLKDEKDFDMGKVSVSWHADSSLVDGSTIAVYVGQARDGVWESSEEGKKVQKKEKKKRKAEGTAKREEWKVALRVVHDIAGPTSKQTGFSSKPADSPTPPVVVNTADGDVYFMLDDFNHHHQHAVLAGDSCVRYTSTHRVGLTEGHTFESIKRRCEKVLEKSRGDHEENLTLHELEFEWLRQFYIQGQKHFDIHAWWHEPMQELCSLWERLNAVVVKRMDDLISQALTMGGADGAGPVLDAMTIVKGNCLKRHNLRLSWANRAVDKCFDKLPVDCRPIPCPIDSVLAVEEDRLSKFEAAMNKLSAEKKKTKLCHMFEKFGDCKKATCNRVHTNGVLKNGVWVKKG